MKRIYALGLAIILLSVTISCSNILTRVNVVSSTALFDKSPIEIIDYINSNIENPNAQFSKEFSKYASYHNTLIQTFLSTKNTLKILLNAQTSEVLAIRLEIADRATIDDYMDIAKAIVEITGQEPDQENVNEITMYFKNYAKLKVDNKDICLGNVTFSFGHEKSNYIFTVSKGSTASVGWGKPATFKKMNILIGDDWAVYLNYDGLGNVYQNSTGLKISIIAANLNIPLLNIDTVPPIVLTKPETVSKYLVKGQEATIKSLTTEHKDWTTSEKVANPKSISSVNGLESSFSMKDNNGQITMSNRQLTLLTDSYSYTIFVERFGVFSSEDLELFDSLIKTIQIR